MNLPYQTHLQQKNLSKITIKNYLSDFRKFSNWYQDSYGQPFGSTGLTKNKLHDYANFLISNESLSKSSKERNLTSMKIFIRWFNGVYNTSVSLSSLHRGLDAVSGRKTVTSTGILPKFGKFPRVLKAGLFSAALFFLAISFVFYNSESLASASKRSRENEFVGGRERIVYYSTVNDFREDFARLKPDSFGFNYDTGEYFIVYEAGEEDEHKALIY
jgi:hypothetical protein